MKKKLLFMLSSFLCICVGAFAQVSVSGKVTDATGNALEGVTISVKGTTNSTTTLENGMFSLTNVPSTSSVLVFSFVGFATQETTVGNKTTFNIRLVAAEASMDTLVVIGYGTAKKREYTGAVTSVNSKMLSTQANSTVTRALEGVVPGIQVSAVDGQPGLDMGIRLRGAGSMSQNTSNALIVIDGVPAEYPNALSSINPKDIASISVLKDAASTAVYGSRGANGVLLVTTKKGVKGRTNISLETRMGYNYLGNMRYDRMDNAKDFYEHAWQVIYNSARFGVNGTASTDNTYSTNVAQPNMSHEDAAQFASAHLFDYTGSTTNFSRNLLGNWMLYDVPGAVYTTTGSGANASATMSGAYLVNPDGKLNPNARQLYSAGSYEDYFFERMFRQEHTLSASGGSDKMDYFVSMGMLEDPSYIRGSQFKRYNVRSNVNAQVTDWLKIGGNVGYSYRNTQSPATRFGRNPGTVVQNAFRWTNGQNPLIPLFARDREGNIIKNADGTDKVNDNVNQTYTPLGQSTQFPNGTTGSPLYTTNLIKLLDKDIDRRTSHDLNLKGYATVNFLNDFKFTANLSYDRFSENRLRFGNTETGAVQGVGALGQTYSNTGVFNTQQLLNWDKGFGNHSITALLGHEFNEWKSDLLNYNSAYALIDDFTGYANFVGRYTSGNAPFSAPGGGADVISMESYFGRVSYNYDDKYFLEGSARRDGSSKFRYEKDRWGTFWSVGAGWRIAGEKFMEGTKGWLNDLKLRASYGVIGNQSGIANYSGYQLWSYGAVYQQASSGAGIPASFTLGQGAFVNNALTWENTQTFDAGVDFSIWNGRLNGSIDYYDKYTVNAMFGQPIAVSLGQPTLTLNSAKIRNRGIEIDVNIDVIRNDKLRWNIGLNGTHYRTILESVPASVLSGALGGKYTAGVDGWGANGGGSTGTSISYLRGPGMDYYTMYLYKYGGVDQATGLPLFHHNTTAVDTAAGRWKELPLGSEVKTTDFRLADRYNMGSAIPKWIGGFTTTIQYKNFDLMAILAYQIGGKFLSVEYANHLYRSGNIGHALSAELIGNTWTPENRDAKFPMALYNDNANFTAGSTHGSWQYSDMSLFDASYLNVKNITLGYSFTSNIANKIKAKSIRVYASADNIAMFTSHSGIDPRMSLVGGMEVGAAVYLPMSTMSMGINVNF